MVGVVLNKSAKQKGLGEAEIEEARLAATNFVREALRGPGDLPPPDPSAMFSAACGLRVQGSLPLYHDKGQRCCKVSHEMLPAGQKLELLQQQKQQDLRDGGAATDGVAAGGNGAAPQARRRVLEEGQRREDIPEPGMPLPGVLRAQRTGTVGGQEVACFPSFIIAGTQKSGTTALTGERGERESGPGRGGSFHVKFFFLVSEGRRKGLKNRYIAIPCWLFPPWVPRSSPAELCQLVQRAGAPPYHLRHTRAAVRRALEDRPKRCS